MKNPAEQNGGKDGEEEKDCWGEIPYNSESRQVERRRVHASTDEDAEIESVELSVKVAVTFCSASTALKANRVGSIRSRLRSQRT